MMKLALSASLALTASLASAQDYNTSAPFTLQLSSADAGADADGQFLHACHAGAAIEELCLGGTDGTPASSNTFALNTTDCCGLGAPYEAGVLVWVLQGTGFNVSSGLAFTPRLDSNVVAPEFLPGPSTDYVGFDGDDKLFIYSAYYDETNFTAGVFPTEIAQVPLYQWYACYTYSSAYYYQTLAWVTAGEPINPTCQAVNVTRVFI